MNTGFSSWSLVRVRYSAPAVAATASVITAKIRVRIALSKHSVQGRTGQLGLGNEASRSALGDQRAEVRRVAARRQHDRRRVAVRAQRRRDGESVHVGELDVEQDDVGMEAVYRFDGRGSVLRLADDVEPVRLEDRAGGRSEAGMIVDDQYGGHGAKCGGPRLAPKYG